MFKNIYYIFYILCVPVSATSDVDLEVVEHIQHKHLCIVLIAIGHISTHTGSLMTELHGNGRTLGRAFLRIPRGHVSDISVGRKCSLYLLNRSATANPHIHEVQVVVIHELNGEIAHPYLEVLCGMEDVEVEGIKSGSVDCQEVGPAWLFFVNHPAYTSLLGKIPWVLKFF